jgi:hypothetical protein
MQLNGNELRYIYSKEHITLATEQHLYTTTQELASYATISALGENKVIQSS